MPVLGLGTWNMTQCQAYKAVTNAIDVGYRHIDCAQIHENEHGVGKALKKKMNDCVIKRDDLFVTSKLWNTFHRPDLVKTACEKSLNDLNLDYLDMYLMQWPMAYKEGDKLLPYDDVGQMRFSSIDYVDTWRAMEKLVRLGYCKSIGVSNFNKSQLERLLEVARVRPATNQVECHPYLNQSELKKYCNVNGIVITAYSPLGSPCRPWIKSNEPVLLDDPAIIHFARRYRKKPAQILLRYQVQRGNVAIPKARFRNYIEENIDIFDFYLSVDDMKFIDTFHYNGRYITLDFQAADHMHYPFKDELVPKPKLAFRKSN